MVDSVGFFISGEQESETEYHAHKIGSDSARVGLHWGCIGRVVLYVCKVLKTILD